MRRLPITLVASLVLVGAPVPQADAATRFRPCASSGDVIVFAAQRSRARGLECARVRVPLDRSGSLPGAIRLRVERKRAAGRRRGAVLAFAGGPGQAATPVTERFTDDLAPALRTRDLIVFDQRGTGGSGLLRCPTLETANLLSAGREALRCARRLGPRRSRYTTRDSVEDVEAVRRAIGVERVTLFGVSYGTKLALAYAARHPQHVERIVLDSVVEAGGPDPLYRDTFAAMPRALRSACGRRGCRDITADPTRDLARLVRRLRRGPARGYVVGSDGRRREARLGRAGLFAILLAGDFDDSLRARLPGAVRSALQRDFAPILRLARRARAVEGEPYPPSVLSSAVYAATSCEETAFPWQRTAPPAQRLAQARTAVGGIPSGAFAPFDRATALASDLLRLCARWPTVREPPTAPPGPLPDVPTLVLAGGQDLRTPVEGARRVARAFARGQLVVAPNTGHDVLGSDLSSCARRAVRAFFGSRRIRPRCRGGSPAVAPQPVAPRSLGAAPRARGVAGRRGRTLSAVRLTYEDVLDQALSGSEGDEGSVRGGGLRNGRFTVDVRGLERLNEIDIADVRELERALARLELELRLRDVVYVPGVSVSGALRIGATDSVQGRLTVSGDPAAAGVLNVRGDDRRVTFTGTLDGRAVRASETLGAPAVRLARVEPNALEQRRPPPSSLSR